MENSGNLLKICGFCKKEKMRKILKVSIRKKYTVVSYLLKNPNGC
jgi:hypothetical protein